MLFAAVCLSVLAFAASAPPKPCCCPPKWEALMGETVETLKDKKTWYMKEGACISVSWDDQKVFAMGTANFSTGNTVNMKVLQDFKDHVQYVIAKGKCTKSKLEGKMQNGVPENATYIGSFYMGSGVGNSLEVENWAVKIGDCVESMTVTKTGCIPLGMVVAGVVSDTDVMSTIGFVNVTAGIKDPSVFVVPSICKKVSSDHPSQQLTGYLKVASQMFRR